MALRIEKAFGVKMETLMRMQSAYDMAKTRSAREPRVLRRSFPWTTTFSAAVSRVIPFCCTARVFIKSEL